MGPWWCQYSPGGPSSPSQGWTLFSCLKPLKPLLCQVPPPKGPAAGSAGPQPDTSATGNQISNSSGRLPSKVVISAILTGCPWPCSSLFPSLPGPLSWTDPGLVCHTQSVVLCLRSHSVPPPRWNETTRDATRPHARLRGSSSFPQGQNPSRVVEKMRDAFFPQWKRHWSLSGLGTPQFSPTT